MNIEILKELFNKYGFHSLKKEPFIYKHNNELGIVYSFDDPFYGELTRVVKTKTTSDAENFLEKYNFFKKYNKKYNLNLELSDYKIENPEIKIIKDNKECTIDELKKIVLSNQNITDENKQKNAIAYLKKLKRTLFLIVSIIDVKRKVEEDIYHSLQKLILSYKEKEEEYNSKLIKLNKKNVKQITINYDVKKSYLLQNDFSELKDKINLIDSKELLENEINALVYKLENSESDENLISNKYGLIKMPLLIEELKEKIKVIDNALSKKRKIFAKKENVDLQLSKISSSSVVNQMVTLENFQKNEVQRIKEKYSMIPELDKRTIADFLIEFDNLKIKEPDIKELKITPQEEVSYENTMQDLENNYKNKSEEEKKVLILYHSILRYIIFEDKIISEKEIKELINIINNPANIMIKIKYFKNINTNNATDFIKSLRKEASKLEKILPISIAGQINVFFKDKKIITAKKYLQASNKKSLAPVQDKNENDLNYIAILKSKTLVHFIPEEISYDYENDDTLIKRTKMPFFLIDLQKNTIKNLKSDIIKIVKYKPIFQNEKDIMIVSDLISQKIEQYKKIEIERNEKND